MTRQCPICSREFQTTPYRVARGWSVYCCRACLSQGRLKGQIHQCAYCGKDVYRAQGRIKKSSCRLFFCTKNCRCSWANTQRAREKHPNWKGGESTYRDAMFRSGPEPTCRRCGLTDQRVLSVHHLDEDRSNNRLENLMWLCHNCHYLIHHHEDERKALMAAIG